jgi:hypothetical protein
VVYLDFKHFFNLKGITILIVKEMIVCLVRLLHTISIFLYKSNESRLDIEEEYLPTLLIDIRSLGNV